MSKVTSATVQNDAVNKSCKSLVTLVTDRPRPISSDLMDILSFKVLILVDKIIEENKKLEEHMRSGFFLMSKSRYTMGCKAVSPTQYDTDNMSANVKMDVQYTDTPTTSTITKNETNLDDITSLFTKYVKFEDSDMEFVKNCLQHNSKNDWQMSSEIIAIRYPQFVAQYASPNKEPETSITESAGIRRRHNILGHEDDKKLGLELQDITTQTQSKNPLNWFGILVPHTLRQCQKEFQMCITVCSQLASYKSELLELIHHYWGMAKDTTVEVASDE